MWSLMYKRRDLKRIILRDESSDIGKDRLSTGTSPFQYPMIHLVILFVSSHDVYT